MPKRSPARPPASAFLLPPFTRNLSPARLHPDASLGGEAPGCFPASLLPRSLSSQTPLFFSWTGSHPLLSPSFSSGSLPLPLAECRLCSHFPWLRVSDFPPPCPCLGSYLSLSLSLSYGAVSSSLLFLAWSSRPFPLLESFLGPCPSSPIWSSRLRTQLVSTSRGLLPQKDLSQT